IVAGGFHTKGISEQLKKKGIGYIVIAPKISDIKEKDWDKYYKLMRGDIDIEFKELVEGSKLALPSFMGMGWFKRLVIGWAIGNMVNKKGLDIDGLESYLKQWRGKKLVLNRFENTLELNTKEERIGIELKDKKVYVLNREELDRRYWESRIGRLYKIDSPIQINQGIEATIAGVEQEQKINADVSKEELEEWIKRLEMDDIDLRETKEGLFIYNKAVADKERTKQGSNIVDKFKISLKRNDKNGLEQNVEKIEGEDKISEEYKRFLEVRENIRSSKEKIITGSKKQKFKNRNIFSTARNAYDFLRKLLFGEQQTAMQRKIDKQEDLKIYSDDKDELRRKDVVSRFREERIKGDYRNEEEIKEIIKKLKIYFKKGYFNRSISPEDVVVVTLTKAQKNLAINMFTREFGENIPNVLTVKHWNALIDKPSAEIMFVSMVRSQKDIFDALRGKRIRARYRAKDDTVVEEVFKVPWVLDIYAANDGYFIMANVEEEQEKIVKKGKKEWTPEKKGLRKLYLDRFMWNINTVQGQVVDPILHIYDDIEGQWRDIDIEEIKKFVRENKNSDFYPEYIEGFKNLLKQAQNPRVTLRFVGDYSVLKEYIKENLKDYKSSEFIDKREEIDKNELKKSFIKIAEKAYEFGINPYNCMLKNMNTIGINFFSGREEDAQIAVGKGYLEDFAVVNKVSPELADEVIKIDIFHETRHMKKPTPKDIEKAKRKIIEQGGNLNFLYEVSKISPNLRNLRKELIKETGAETGITQRNKEDIAKNIIITKKVIEDLYDFQANLLVAESEGLRGIAVDLWFNTELFKKNKKLKEQTYRGIERFLFDGLIFSWLKPRVIPDLIKEIKKVDEEFNSELGDKPLPEVVADLDRTPDLSEDLKRRVKRKFKNPGSEVDGEFYRSKKIFEHERNYDLKNKEDIKRYKIPHILEQFKMYLKSTRSAEKTAGIIRLIKEKFREKLGKKESSTDNIHYINSWINDIYDKLMDEIELTDLDTSIDCIKDSINILEELKIEYSREKDIIESIDSKIFNLKVELLSFINHKNDKNFEQAKKLLRDGDFYNAEIFFFKTISTSEEILKYFNEIKGTEYYDLFKSFGLGAKANSIIADSYLSLAYIPGNSKQEKNEYMQNMINYRKESAIANQEIKNYEKQARSYFFIGKSLLIINELESAEYYFNRALSLYKKLGKERKQIECNTYIAYLWHQKAAEKFREKEKGKVVSAKEAIGNAYNRYV
ncbi:MAG: hypothetical protein ACOC56_04600, partial [Atribacterota bacterium]